MVGSRLGFLAVVLAAWLVAGPAGAAIFDVTSFGADPAFAGLDTPAANAAVDAACAAGGGEVHFPAGFYRLGHDTGPSSGFYSGLQVSCDNIVISGVGDTSVLMPENSGGQTVITLCAEITGGFGSHCTFTNPVNNITIRDLKIWDDDPLGHRGSEESHGVTGKNVHQVVLERLTLESLGDESVTFSGGSSDVTVQDSSFADCPSLNSGGSCVELDGGSDYEVLRNSFDGGAYFGAMIFVNTNAPTEVTAVLIQDNQLLDSSPTSPGITNAGIWLAANNAAIRDVQIIDNTISMDYLGRDAVRFAGGSFDVEDLTFRGNDIGGSVDLRNDYLKRLIFAENDLVSTNGLTTPGLNFSGDDVQITDNTISGQRSSCIEIGGFNGSASNVEIRHNLCFSNSDTLDEPIIIEADISCAPLPTVSGGLVIEDNLLIAGGLVSNGIELSGCSTATIRNNGLYLGGSGALYGMRGGASFAGNTIVGANVSIRTMTTPAQVSNNTLDGNTCVRLDGTMGSLVVGNNLLACGEPIEETNGADLNSCWNNSGVADGCSLILGCHDGVDNDGDGQIDALDTNCTPTAQLSESPVQVSCGLGAELAPLLVALGQLRRRRRA